VAVLALLVAPATLHAQTYPHKPIRLIVPSPPGGGTDTLSRLVATKLGEARQWQILVDNRPGAGGNIGMELAAKAPPDGYTIVMGESSNLTINPYLYSKLAYDPAKDLTPVVFVGMVPLVLVISPARQFDSIATVVAAAKEKRLTMASGGNGTVGHLAGELWMRRAAITLQHVPYRGGGPAVTDVMGGQVDLHFA
jgi:tripartite-type tricarboxylate transporter receptor subunit TctC